MRLCKLHVLIVWGLVILSNHVVASQAAAYTLFGSQEIRANDLSPFPKWTGVLERYVSERPLESSECNGREFNRCHLQEWKEFLSGLYGLDKRKQVDAVQHYVNNVKYVLDPVNWGMPDYWTTPKQFFIKDGDCEDYAITKFLSLKALGFAVDDMRVVILQDLNLNLLHSVLVVYLDGEALVLDNQIPHVIAAKDIHHYKPIYSVNEKFWWRYRS